jgi:hypothetical protein
MMAENIISRLEQRREKTVEGNHRRGENGKITLTLQIDT